jgi:predicted dehydrogenase
LKVLIIGLGSIAHKHINALRKIEVNVEIFALRSNRPSSNIEGIINIFSIKEAPQNLSFIIISNPTFKHYETINLVLDLGVPLFIEKPPLDNVDHIEKLLKKIRKKNVVNYTAFNLRFNPVLQWLKKNISKYRVIEVNSYCGSYLPNWRKEIDYRKNYSAIKEMGGGVHLDLIHEIDYLKWLFGNPNKLVCSLNTISELEINSIDSARYILDYDKMSISLTLNYFRRDAKRDLEILTKDNTLYCNLLNHEIWDLTNQILIEKFDPVDSLYTYTEQLKYFINSLKNRHSLMNDLNESLNTLKICLNRL